MPTIIRIKATLVEYLTFIKTDYPIFVATIARQVKLKASKKCELVVR